MTRRKALHFAFAAPALAAPEQDSAAIRALLHQLVAEINRPEHGDLRKLFTANADFRRGAGPVVSLLERFRRLDFKRQPWSERTPWAMREDSTRHIDASHALVDATFSQYGSTIPKLEMPVVLMVEKETGMWKVSSFRMPATVPETVLE